MAFALAHLPSELRPSTPRRRASKPVSDRGDRRARPGPDLRSIWQMSAWHGQWTPVQTRFPSRSS